MGAPASAAAAPVSSASSATTSGSSFSSALATGSSGVTVMSLLENEIEDLLRFLEPTATEVAMRELAVNSLTDVVKQLWPTATVALFGSFDTGLFLPMSDIDLVVHYSDEHAVAALSSSSTSSTPSPRPSSPPPQAGAPAQAQLQQPPVPNGTAPPPPRARPPVELMRQLFEALKQSGRVTEPRFLDQAKVPIIKCRERITQFDVDISFNQTQGEQGASFTKEKLIQFPLLRPLLVLLKFALTTRNLNETFSGGLGSFALLLLALRYCQWATREPTYDTLTIGALLTGFLHFFGFRFNYVEHAVSVRGEGCFLPKGMISAYDPTRPFLLALEDPFRPGVDLGKSSYNITLVQHAFRYSFHHICERMERLKRAFEQQIADATGPVDPLLMFRIYLEHSAEAAAAAGRVPPSLPMPPPPPPPGAALTPSAAVGPEPSLKQPEDHGALPGSGDRSSRKTTHVPSADAVASSALGSQTSSATSSSTASPVITLLNDAGSSSDHVSLMPVAHPALSGLRRASDDGLSMSVSGEDVARDLMTVPVDVHLHVPQLYLLVPLIASGSGQLERLLQQRARLELQAARPVVVESPATPKRSSGAVPVSFANAVSPDTSANRRRLATMVHEHSGSPTTAALGSPHSLLNGLPALTAAEAAAAHRKRLSDQQLPPTSTAVLHDGLAPFPSTTAMPMNMLMPGPVFVNGHAPMPMPMPMPMPVLNYDPTRPQSARPRAQVRLAFQPTVDNHVERPVTSPQHCTPLDDDDTLPVPPSVSGNSHAMADTSRAASQPINVPRGQRTDRGPSSQNRSPREGSERSTRGKQPSPVSQNQPSRPQQQPSATGSAAPATSAATAALPTSASGKRSKGNRTHA